jgi:hypothetical protein
MELGIRQAVHGVHLQHDVALMRTCNFKHPVSHVTRHTSHVTRHTSHVTRHTSHITRHMSHVTHPKSIACASACGVCIFK